MRRLLVLSLCIGCHRGAPKLTAHRLPGFSLSLPAGDVVADESSKYTEGVYGVGITGSWAVMAEWRTGPLGERDRALYAEAWHLDFTKPLAFASPKLAAQTYAGTNHGPARVSFLTCGKRYLVIGTIDRNDVDKLHRDVLATVTCTPDAAKERAVAARITLASREGWSRVGDDPRVLTLSRNGGAQVLLGLYYPTAPDQIELERLVARYHGTVGAGDPHPITAAGVRGWIRVLACGRDNHVVVAYIEQGGGAAERTVIDGVRCLRDDEPDVGWPH